MNPTTASARAPGKAFRIIVWVLQVWMTVVFTASGYFRLAFSKEELLKYGNVWVNWVSENQIRLIGVAEVLGALGLILPSVTRIQPKLTPIAALCLSALMAGAAVLHFTHDDAKHAPPSIVLGAICLFIAWARWVKAPIAPRG